MTVHPPRMSVTVRQMKRYTAQQTAIILVFILLSSLVSILLPIYFANMTLQGL